MTVPTSTATAVRHHARPVARRRLIDSQRDHAALARARELLAAARSLETEDPRAAFELAHRAALRGAGVLVARADRGRRRKLPLNVWAALDRLGGEDRDRARELAPFVTERVHLDADGRALPEPGLLARHLRLTGAHLDRVALLLIQDLDPAAPDALPALAG